jgi:hypothetical protein
MPEAAAAPAAEPTPTTQGAAQQAAPTASPDPVLSAADAKSPTPAVETASPGGKAPDPVADALDKVEPRWRDDWREALANGDEKEMKILQRYASFDNWARAQRELRTKLSSGAYKATLPDNADEADVAAFRKSWGVPDAPDGYGIEFPKIDGYEPSDADKSDLNEFLTAMHKGNAPPGLVKAATDYYWSKQVANQQQLRDAALETTINRRSEIRAEWGKDYDRNTKIGNADMSSLIGEDGAKELASQTLADGTKLGDHPQFTRYILAAALRNAGDAALAMPDIATQTAGGLDAAYAAALDVQWTNPREYHSPTHQQKLERLAAAKAARGNKTSRPQAA